MRSRSVGSRAAYVLTGLVVVASMVASLGGLFVPGLYQDDSTWATAALRGGDLVTLVAVVPALVVVTLLARRGSFRGLLVWAGLLAYGGYNFAFYVFGAAFNDLFLVRVVAFSGSVFGLVALLSSMDTETIAARFGAETPRRVIGSFLLVVAGAFTTLWGVFSLRYAITGSLSLGAATLPGMHLVFALDLSLMAPSMALAGILLWRHRPWGWTLGTALCVFGAAYQLNLVAAGMFQWKAHVVGVKQFDPIGIAVAVAFMVASIAMLWNLRPERSIVAADWSAPRDAVRAQPLRGGAR